MSSLSADGARPELFVSAGRLPAPDAVRAIVDEARVLAHTDGSGALSTVYPGLSGAWIGLPIMVWWFVVALVVVPLVWRP